MSLGCIIQTFGLSEDLAGFFAGKASKQALCIGTAVGLLLDGTKGKAFARVGGEVFTLVEGSDERDSVIENHNPLVSGL